MYYSVLQCVAVRRSALLRVAVRFNVLQSNLRGAAGAVWQVWILKSRFSIQFHSMNWVSSRRLRILLSHTKYTQKNKLNWLK